MLTIFRRNILLYSLLLVPYIFIVHGGRLLVNHSPNKLLYTWAFDSLIQWLAISDQASFYVSHILVFIQAMLLTFITNRIKLIPEGQLFPALAFIILTGLHSSIFSLNAILFANLFFILALLSISSVYLLKQATLTLFNFGFFIGIASIFYPPYIWMLFLGIFGLTVYRGFNGKEFLQIISGFLIVLFLFFSTLYLKKDIDNYWNHQIKEFFNYYILSMKFSTKGLVALTLIFLLFLLSFVRFNILQLKAQISIQKTMDFLFWTSFISLFTLFFVRIESIAHIIILITPLSIFLAIIVAKIKNELMAETIHMFFALLALFLQLQNW